MLLHEFGAPPVRSSLVFCIAETSVLVEAPAAILSVIDATLSHVPRRFAVNLPDISISVQPKDDVWEIRGNSGSFKVLGGQSALPQVAGAVVSSAIGEVAISRKYKTLRASVVEKDGRALAFIGDDWESSITIAAHLHGRGWSFVGSDHALINPDTLDVFPVEKSLYVNSSSIARFPIEYRRAVEASPWYVTAQGISFYAVDPRIAGYRQTWAAPTKVHGVVVVDGAMADRPALESVDERSFKEDRFARLGVDWRRVGAVDLRIGGFVDTCDLVEHWFESIRV